MILPSEEILTPRCRIAPLRDEHACALQELTDDSVTARVHFLPSPFTLAAARALIEDVGPDNRFFAVEDKLTRQLLGVVGAHLRPGREIETGYWFAAEARGRGLASEAVGSVIARLAARLSGHRIVAECHPANERSAKLLRRLGFQATGRPGHRPERMLFAWREPVSARIDVC